MLLLLLLLLLYVIIIVYYSPEYEYRGNPIQANIIRKLRKLFHHYALFFWDDSDGQYLGILWRPRFFTTKEFTVTESRYRTPHTNKGNETSKVIMEANYEEIIHDMIQVANGMLSKSTRQF
jgi:hypothetical protein